MKRISRTYVNTPSNPIGRLLFLKALSQNAFATAFAQAVSFARAALLARILTPDAFGLFGIALVAFAGLQVLSDFGFKTVLVSRGSMPSSEEQKWLGTVWVLECARGLCVAMVLVLTAGYVAAFFGEPRAIRVIYLVALSAAISGTTNTGLCLLERRLQFDIVASVEQVGAVAGLVAAALTGIWLRSADALAWGMVVTATASSLLSFLVTKERPGACFDRAIARQALEVGRSLSAIGVLTYLTTQFDNIVIGRLLGTAVLGPYVVAYNLAMLPQSIVASVANRVLTPYYAQRVSASLEDAMVKWAHSLRLTGWLLFASALPLMSSGGFLVRTLYGEKWPAAAEVVGLLAIAGLLRGFAKGASPMLLAQGRQIIDLKAKLVETVLFVGLVLVFVGQMGLGVQGAAWAGVACYALAAVIRVAVLLRVSEAARRVLHQGSWRMAVGCGLGYVCAEALNWSAAPAPIVVMVGMGVVLGAAWFSEPHLRRVVQANG